MGWGLLEPLDHSHLWGVILTMIESLIKSHVFFHTEMIVGLTYE